MYIRCVTLCLFSALSRSVGALQISIIIIIKTEPAPPSAIGHREYGNYTHHPVWLVSCVVWFQGPVVSARQLDGLQPVCE